MKKIFLILALACASFTSNAQLTVGDNAPDFTVTDVHGVTHTLSDYLNDGKHVVLDFFYYNCGPCQTYTPQISLAYTNYGCNTNDVAFIAIDFNDNDAQVLQFEQNFGGGHPAASGLEGGGNAVVSAYGINSYPTILLINPSGEIIEDIGTPTLVVFNYHFDNYGIEEAPCNVGLSTEELENVQVYPNPSNGSFNVNFGGVLNGTISLNSLDGKEIKKDVVEGASGFYFDTDNLSSGVYVLKISSDKGFYTQQVVVK